MYVRCKLDIFKQPYLIASLYVCDADMREIFLIKQEKKLYYL